MTLAAVKIEKELDFVGTHPSPPGFEMAMIPILWALYSLERRL